MSKSYRHLTKEDRIFLGTMLHKGYAKSKIASILGVHRSTIYREIKRNGSRPMSSCVGTVFYISTFAQQKYKNRRARLSKLIVDKSLRAYVYEKLLKGWSPWQKVGLPGKLKGV